MRIGIVGSGRMGSNTGRRPMRGYLACRHHHNPQTADSWQEGATAAKDLRDLAAPRVV